MNLQPLYDVKARLEQAAVAGTGLLSEDFRLQRAAESLKPLAAASPVFGKIHQGLAGLLAAPREEQGGLLLDLLALTDAVVYTQGVSRADGALEPLPPGPGTCLPLSYSQLNPLLTALTGKGGGRLAVIKSVQETHPAFLGDFRVLPALISGLGDSYGELAELNLDILKSQTPAIVPLLKEGLDPAGKKEMARRVEVIAALEGTNAAPWLRELLPQARKEVRPAVLLALSGDPANLPLALELAKTEKGKNRQAVLTGLSRLDGEEVRAFWEAELEHEPGSIQFLENLTQDWASDLAAAGLRRRLELALDGDDKSAPPSAGSVRQWCLAAQGKTSPQMLDCWRWIDRRTASIRQKSEDYVKLFTGILLDSLCQSGGPLCGLCLELWEAHPEEPRYLPHALLAAVLERSPAQVYDTFSPYILTSKPLMGGDKKRALHEAVLSGLSRIRWDREAESYLIYYGTSRPRPRSLDTRWISRLVDAVWKNPEGEDRRCYAPFGSGEAVEQFELTLTDLVNPGDPEACAPLVPYLRRRMVETGSYYTYSQWLLRYHGPFLDLLPQCLKNRSRGAYLYHIWQLFHMAAPNTSRELLISSLEGVLNSGGLRMEDTALAHAAVSYTVSLLRDSETAPFPQWEEWWALR